MPLVCNNYGAFMNGDLFPELAGKRAQESVDENAGDQSYPSVGVNAGD